MPNIVGIGAAGISIADEFAKYPQYTVYKIDSVGASAKNFLKIKKQKTMEDYENNAPSFKKFLKPIKDEVMVIVGGTGKISGIVLKVLETLQQCKISVLYIKPDLSLVNNMKKMQHRIAFNILQQFARSSVIDRIYLISNVELEDILGNVPIVGYYEKLNYLLVSTIHMINVFNNSKSVMDTHPEETLDVAKISTFGIINEKKEEKWFYSIDFPREKAYYYAINKKKLMEDGTLFKSLKEQIKTFTMRYKNAKVSYGIYETEYKQDVSLCVAHLSKIQD